MPVSKLVLVGVGIALAVFLLDRVLRWMEGRGWIYYRTQRRGSAGVGNALLGVHALLEPDRRHVLEVRQAEVMEEEDAGDPPVPGGDGGEAAP